MVTFHSQLVNIGACAESLEWIGKKSLRVAWKKCKRGDWLIWLAAVVEVDKISVVLAACDCVRLALTHARGPEALDAIETAEAWCRGNATGEQVWIAAKAVKDASASSYKAANILDYSAIHASSAAYYAASTTYAFTSTYSTGGTPTPYASSAVAYAAAAIAEAGVAGAGAEALRSCAAIIRARINVEQIEARLCV